MNEPKPHRKTFTIPDKATPKRHRGVVFSFGSGADELRDVTKPIAYDEHGRPLYAPRGVIVRMEA